MILMVRIWIELLRQVDRTDGIRSKKSIKRWFESDLKQNLAWGRLDRITLKSGKSLKLFPSSIKNFVKSFCRNSFDGSEKKVDRKVSSNDRQIDRRDKFCWNLSKFLSKWKWNKFYFVANSLIQVLVDDKESGTSSRL